MSLGGKNNFCNKNKGLLQQKVSLLIRDSINRGLIIKEEAGVKRRIMNLLILFLCTDL